jgi:hypothetical protein
MFETRAVVEEFQPVHAPVLGDLRRGPAVVAVVVERNAAVGQQLENKRAHHSGTRPTAVRSCSTSDDSQSQWSGADRSAVVAIET